MKQITSHAMTRIGQILHDVRRDQNGSISVTSVFFVIFFAMILGMLMNVGRRADRKIIMQNGSDAAAYSGGVVLARSMNTLAFTNHLLCDVFALTAYLREARDRNSQELSSEALVTWREVAGRFSGAPLPKFSQLAGAIPSKTVLEQNLIDIFSDQNAAISELLLPVMEEILAEEMIPEFQRALVYATPRLATEAAREIAGRHGPGEFVDCVQNQDMFCQMWRTDAQPFGGSSESDRSTLPVADPVFDTSFFQSLYMRNGLRQRRYFSSRYLRMLNNTMLRDFDRVAKMSQFANFWRGFTSGYLAELLDEYPDRNIPYQLRMSTDQMFYPNQYLEDEYMFVGVSYWREDEESLPGLFKNPMDADDVTFTQIRLYLPRGRLIYDPTRPPEYQIYRQHRPTHRDLINQGWTTRIVPATSASIPTILQTAPPAGGIDTPRLGGISVEEFRRINTH